MSVVSLHMCVYTSQCELCCAQWSSLISWSSSIKPYRQVAGVPEQRETPLTSRVPSRPPLLSSSPFHPFPHIPPSFLSLLPHSPAAVTAHLQKGQRQVLRFQPSSKQVSLYKPHTLPSLVLVEMAGVTTLSSHTVLLESNTARAPQRNRKGTGCMCGQSPASATLQLCDLGQVPQPLLAS